MNKQIKILLAFAAVLVIAGAGFYFFITKKSPTVVPTANVTFFYGRECPHCQDVEKFLSDNNIAAKVKYDSVEVWHNQDNANLMLQKAQSCGLDQNSVGVPFVYDAGQNRCYVGTPDVEAFFKGKAGI